MKYVPEVTGDCEIFQVAHGDGADPLLEAVGVLVGGARLHGLGVGVFTLVNI